MERKITERWRFRAKIGEFHLNCYFHAVSLRKRDNIRSGEQTEAVARRTIRIREESIIGSRHPRGCPDKNALSCEKRVAAIFMGRSFTRRHRGR